MKCKWPEQGECCIVIPVWCQLSMPKGSAAPLTRPDGFLPSRASCLTCAALNPKLDPKPCCLTCGASPSHRRLLASTYAKSWAVVVRRYLGRGSRWFRERGTCTFASGHGITYRMLASPNGVRHIVMFSSLSHISPSLHDLRRASGRAAKQQSRGRVGGTSAWKQM